MRSHSPFSMTARPRKQSESMEPHLLRSTADACQQLSCLNNGMREQTDGVAAFHRRLASLPSPSPVAISTFGGLTHVARCNRREAKSATRGGKNRVAGLSVKCFQLPGLHSTVLSITATQRAQVSRRYRALSPSTANIGLVQQHLGTRAEFGLLGICDSWKAYDYGAQRQQ